MVGGDFTQIGGIPANGIAQWDGAEWHAFGGGVNGAVTAVAMHDGDLIAGGRFTRAGDVEAHAIARWDGAAWHALGAGVEGDGHVSPVLALTSFRGDLVAGGSFFQAGGLAVRNVAQWDGSQWSAMGEGIDGGGFFVPTPHVSALVLHAGDLIVGGIFQRAGGVPTAGLARWDGLEWHVDGYGNTGVALLVRDGRLTVISSYWSLSFTPCPGTSLASWDAGAWKPFGGYIAGSTMVAATISGTDLVVASGGDYSVGCCWNELLRWDGMQWTRQGEANAPFHAVGVFRGELITGGSFSEVNGVRVNCIARWTSRCRADFNHSGTIDSQDFFDFLAAFLDGAPNSDFNNDGFVNSQDFFDFLATFFAGCE